MIRRFLGALQFLTLLPIRGDTGPPSQAAVFFPLTGALLGASAGAIFYAGRAGWNASVAALLAIIWLALITGCIHEDGLADVADAFRAGRSREQIQAILKDSRIGTYGAVALIISLLLRWQALAASPLKSFGGLIAALALSRTSMVALAAISPAAGEGLGREFVNGVSTRTAILATAQGVLIAFFAGWRPAILLIFSTSLIVLLARIYFVRRLGGGKRRLPRRCLPNSRDYKPAGADMATLFLIRHCEPERKGVVLGQIDSPLSVAGHRHAVSAFREVADIEALFCSPLLRAKETADYIRALRREILPDLREIDHGQWSGKTWEEIEAQWPDVATRKLVDWNGVTAPGGESWPSFVARIAAAWDVIRLSPHHVAVVAHQGVNAALLSIINGSDPLQFIQQYGEVIRVEYD